MNYNYMSYQVYKNNKLIETGVCDTDRVKDELINDFTAQLFYKTCKIKEAYYKKIQVTWTNVIGTDTYKTVRTYEEQPKYNKEPCKKCENKIICVGECEKTL